MDAIQVIILGAIQGFTEFIPISSSAHLVAIRWFLGWDTQDLVLDVALHLGTLFALFAFFWREWYEMIRDYVRSTRLYQRKSAKRIQAPQTEGLLLWPVILACVPAGLAGVLLEDAAVNVFRQPLVIASTLIVMGLLLLFADRIGKKSRSMNTITTRDWLIIGIAQALAIVPGVSRSGITITAGLLCGLQREASARFSFLLGAPIIFGAAVFELRHLATHPPAPNELIILGLGILASTVVGYLCIGFLMHYLKKHTTDLFVAYRVVLGIGIFISYAFGLIRV